MKKEYAVFRIDLGIIELYPYQGTLEYCEDILSNFPKEDIHSYTILPIFSNQKDSNK